MLGINIDKRIHSPIVLVILVLTAIALGCIGGTTTTRCRMQALNFLMII